MSSHRSISLALAILMVAISSVVHAQDAGPEVGNVALVKAFQSAWNSHDMEGAFRKLLTDDVDWVNIDSSRGKGIDTVVAGHARAHAGKSRNSAMKIKDIEVEPLKPDVALVFVGWEITGDHADDGKTLTPREGLFTWVTVKEGGAWKIRASHNTNKAEHSVWAPAPPGGKP
jgi:uncharacterized protein (TIGR02246 family)